MKAEIGSPKKRNSIVLLLAVLAFAGTALVLQNTVLKKSGSYAQVQVDGEIVARLDLQKDTTLTVGDSVQGSNTIEVKDGRVAVTEADCPDRVCVRTGWQENEGAVIACMPHRLIVTVKGKEQGF